jgi:nucleotide-binding universal stress UspA family protein
MDGDNKPGLLAKILVPLDGSELATRIVTHLRRILARREVEVMLVRVIPPALVASRSESDPLDAANRHLDGVADGLRASGANVRSEVLIGEPSDRILMLTREYRPTLVAMATHGRTGFARWIRGSVAERVLRSSPAPLLLANPFGLEAHEELRFRRILVPLDGSAASAQILPLVAEVAGLQESEVILQTVVEFPITDYPLNVTLVTEEDAHKLLEGYRQQLPGLRVRIVAGLGVPARSIVERAEREKIDLVAMTTHGWSGASRWAFGSVAEQVIRHAACPLLVKRTGGFSDPD